MFTKENNVKIATALLSFSVILMLVSTFVILVTSGLNGLTPQTGLTLSFALMSMGLFYSNQALK